MIYDPAHIAELVGRRLGLEMPNWRIVSSHLLKRAE